MKDKSIKIFFLIVIVFNLCGCMSSLVLEKENAGISTPVIEKINGENFLLFSGLCMHSSFIVSDVVVTYNDDQSTATVIVTAVPEFTCVDDKKHTGNFHFNVKLSDKLKAVYFGNKKIEIWKRN